MLALRGALLCFLVGPAVCSEECEEVPQFLQHSLQLDAQESKKSKSSHKVKGSATGSSVETVHFFMNFHDVGGFASIVNVLAQHSRNCAHCGGFLFDCQEEGLSEAECLAREPEYCTDLPRACTHDSGLSILGDAIGGYEMKDRVNSSDLSSLKNLWPDSKRFALLSAVDRAHYWLPAIWGPMKRVLVTTILRDPLKKLRSAYNRINELLKPLDLKAYLEAQRDFVLGNASQEVYAKPRQAVVGCCEYSFYLGNNDVQKAKRVLASQFDFVGIAESMPETMVSLGWLYGKSPAGMGILARNTYLEVPDAEDWKKDEEELAMNITKKDRKIYEFAKTLFQRQSVSMWNNQEVLEKQAKLFEEAKNTPWEPE